MDSTTRTELARSLRVRLAATPTKVGVSSTPTSEPNLPPPSISQTPISFETPLGPSSPPQSPRTLLTPNSPPPIAAVPLAVASSPALAPRDKGKRVLEILSDDEDSGEGLVFKRRRAARAFTPPPTSPMVVGLLGIVHLVPHPHRHRQQSKKGAAEVSHCRLHHQLRRLLLLHLSSPARKLSLFSLQLFN